MWQPHWHCTTFYMFEFDMTDSVLLGCVTVLLHVLLLLFTVLLFTFFYYFVCFYVLWAYT